MTEKNDVRPLVFVRRKPDADQRHRSVNAQYITSLPCGELISGLLKTVSRSISGIDLGMHHVRIRKCHRDEVVHVGGKAPETCLIAHKAMNVHEKYTAAARVLQGGVWNQ